MSTRTGMAMLLFGVVGFSFWLLWPDGGEADRPSSGASLEAKRSGGPGGAGRFRHPPARTGGGGNGTARPAGGTHARDARGSPDLDKERRAALARLQSDWEALSGLGPAEMLARQRELAARAVAELGAGPAMGRFMEFLKEKGAGDALDWLATEGLAGVFSGPQAAGARAWLAGLKDAKLAEKIAFQAGRGYGGADLDGFRDYLYGFGDIHVQSALLAGYCAGMAAGDPEGAVRAFFDLKPPKVDFTGLRRVMLALPPDSPFAKISAKLPGDDKPLAKRARRALLEAWTRADPVQAAQFVVLNARTVAPDQLGPVVDRWLEADPAAAEGWIGRLPEGEHRDTACAAEAEHFLDADPARAWEAVPKIGDFKRRVKAARKVYEDWALYDEAAARAAWEKLFAQGGGGR